MAENGMQGLLAMAVFKDFNVYALGIFRAQTPREFHFAVNGIVVPDEAAHKPHYEDRTIPRAPRSGFTAARSCKRGGDPMRGDERGKQNNESRYPAANPARQPRENHTRYDDISFCEA